MKTAIIHIGAHKTGTTTIQVALHNNASLLNALGIEYPVELTSAETGMYGQHSLSFQLRGIGHHIGKDGVSVKTCRDGISPLDHIRQMSRDKDLILSSEDYYDLDVRQIEKLRDALSGFAVKIVFYIRRQDETAQALYQTAVVNYGLDKSFEQYLTVNDSRFDYYAIARKWSKIFGRESLIIRRYERDALIKRDALADFIATVESLLGRGLNSESWTPVRSDLNQGVPEHVVTLMRRYNSAKNLGAVIAPLIRGIGYMLYQEARGCYEIASPAVRQAIIDNYAESNARLAREYLNLQDGMLFSNMIVKQSEEDWALKQSDVDGCLSKFLEDVFISLKNSSGRERSGGRETIVIKESENRQNVSVQWQAESAYSAIQAEARKLTPDEWIGVVGAACEGPVQLGAIDLPGAPASAVQSVFVGASGRTSLIEGGRFYKFVLDVMGREELAGLSSLLDFGCGWGRFTRLFQREVKEGGLYGVDPWNYAINLCRTHFPFAGFVQSDFLPPLRFRDNTFDVVVAYSVFSHLVEHAALSWINELSRVLRPGGLLIVTTHGPWVMDNVNSVRSGVRKACNKWEEGIVSNWPDVAPLLEKYNAGEFVFIPNRQSPLPTNIYGNAFIPRSYVERVFGQYMEFRDFVCDRSRISQAAFVLKKSI